MLSAWAIGNGEKERMLPHLGINSSAEDEDDTTSSMEPGRVSLPWDDPGGCGGTSSVGGHQFSEAYQLLRFQTISSLWPTKDSVLQGIPGERFWKHQSFGGGDVGRVLIAQQIGDFRVCLSL